MSKIAPLRWSKAQREVPPNEQGRLSRRPFSVVVPLSKDQAQGLIHIVADLLAPTAYPAPGFQSYHNAVGLTEG